MSDRTKSTLWWLLALGVLVWVFAPVVGWWRALVVAAAVVTIVDNNP